MASLKWFDQLDSWSAHIHRPPDAFEVYAEVIPFRYRNRTLWVSSDGNTVQMDQTDIYDSLDEAKAAVEARYAAEQTPHIVEATVQAKSVLVAMSDGRRWRVLLSELETAENRDPVLLMAYRQGVEL